MRCQIATAAGQVVLDGVCGVRRDGDLEVVPVRATRPLRSGEGPLLVTTGSQQYPAQVIAVHHTDRDPSGNGADVYHLTLLSERDAQWPAGG
jgi:hypothetical protein